MPLLCITTPTYVRLHFKSNFELIQILFLKYCHSPFFPFDMCKAKDTLRVLISSPWIPFIIPEGPLHQFLPNTGNPWKLPETNWSGFLHRFEAKELKVPESFCTSHASLANYHWHRNMKLFSSPIRTNAEWILHSKEFDIVCKLDWGSCLVSFASLSC